MIDSLWDNLKGFLNSTFFAVVVVGSIAAMYSEAWLPSTADREERRNLLFELNYRAEKELENPSPMAEYLNGQRTALIDGRFRDLALRYTSLGGQQGQEFTRYGMMEDNELSEQAANIQTLVQIAIAEEGFDFGYDQQNIEGGQMEVWQGIILGVAVGVSLLNTAMILCILYAGTPRKNKKD